jgi:hypothetical protein
MRGVVACLVLVQRIAFDPCEGWQREDIDVIESRAFQSMACVYVSIDESAS